LKTGVYSWQCDLGWAVQFERLGGFGLFAMKLFLSILTIGLVYEWRKGALEWD